MISLISTWRLIGWNVKEVGGFLVGLCIWDDDSPVWLIGLENGSLNDSFIVLECGHSFKYHYCNGQYSIYIHLWLYIYTYYDDISGCWFGTWILWLSIYWECHHPDWRTHIFQRGRYTTNQNRFQWFMNDMMGMSQPTLPYLGDQQP